VISPTRELAIQIFEVLRKIGPYHSFSAGLVIGGKNVKDEMERLTKMNILVATPGRLLQHMDQTVGFECDNLQLLGPSRPCLRARSFSRRPVHVRC
jgi:ATP-dependent RNA helicase DDX10/DBP4